MDQFAALIRKWLDSCLKRIREKEQSLLASLKLMNEPVLNMLRPVTEDGEDDTDDDHPQYLHDEGGDQQRAPARTESVVSQAERRFLTPLGAAPAAGQEPGARERRPVSRCNIHCLLTKSFILHAKSGSM